MAETENFVISLETGVGVEVTALADPQPRGFSLEVTALADPQGQ